MGSSKMSDKASHEFQLTQEIGVVSLMVKYSNIKQMTNGECSVANLKKDFSKTLY